MWIKSCLLFCLLNIDLTWSTPPKNSPVLEIAKKLAGKYGRCECGKVNNFNRIVGGVVTEKNEFPWMVGLVTVGGVNNAWPFCGGSIVSSKTIVTAAHCIENRSWDKLKVIVDDYDIYSSDGERFVKVCGKAVHPNYTSKGQGYDVGTLTLCEDLTFSHNVAPICLPTISSTASQYENKSAVVIGWGWGNKSGKLEKATLKTMSNSHCRNAYKGIKGLTFTKAILCAFNFQKTTCYGDSGGPLMIEENKSYKLVGIASWGHNCYRASHPGVYVRVTHSLDWINDNIQGYRCQTSF